MNSSRNICVDGNEAVARVAYALSEVIALYPITPSSPMGEHADDWAAANRPNLWGGVPDIIEMQSEAGAAGALHGALQKGALATTFTASQGLLLMVPNMFKIAGELLPAVIHVAARSVATHALSIFGDHSDVMAVRSTGWAMLCSSSVQEAQDLALVAHAATLTSRVPFLHFFDGFRTSHEVSTVTPLDDDVIASMVDDEALIDFRSRSMSPDHPDVRGTAQNPDVFFQGREAANSYHLAVPGIVAEAMSAFERRTGRHYGVVEYVGAPDAERVVVLMGSGCGPVEEVVESLTAAGERVGLLKVRLFRPFPASQLVEALPPSVRAVAVLDRTKEPGSVGEPLYVDVRTAIDEAMDADELPFVTAPRVIGGRYGLSSKEFTPAMAKAVFDELAKQRPKNHFTIGINDDVTHTSLDWDKSFRLARPEGEFQAVFFGLGADGTVGANKNSVKIISDTTGAHAQGYFVYDSKKSGSITISHLRFGRRPVRSTYLVTEADFVACHQFGLLERVKVLDLAKPHATFLLNSPYPLEETWQRLPAGAREQIIAKQIDFFVVDAHKIASNADLGTRINTVMQVCFFALTGVMPTEQAISEIKSAVEHTYGRRGRTVVERNFAAIDAALEGLVRVEPLEFSPVPEAVGADGAGALTISQRVAGASDFVRNVTAVLMADEGDSLPVSALPVDGRFPSGTTRYEKRAIATEIPVWDPSICTDCGKCAMVCPHTAIRMKVFSPDALEGAPEGFLSKAFRSKDLSGHLLTIQVAPDDCTGCGLCVEVCPAKSKTEVKHKSINMEPVLEHRAQERERFGFFSNIAELDRELLPHDSVKGAAVLEPLFEYSGACAGCGETPYVRLLSQLFGDRLLVANATGCSSIYGGNLPTTPWGYNAEGRGPAWANSLFEDNAEFGLGIRLGLEAQKRAATSLLRSLSAEVGPALVSSVLDATQEDEAAISAQRGRVADLKKQLSRLVANQGGSGGNGTGDIARMAAHLLVLADYLVDKSVWIVGGDGWAYDIGFGGLDHVLASGRNVNILVLDTEVYSNTGGQASKATPRAAVARFAASGKGTPKKDLGMIAQSYGNVYVAQVAIGANDIQTVKALLEANAHPGPSLVIAYSTCIAHGIDMSQSMNHQKDAVRSGYWPLYRFRPTEAEQGQPFTLDSREPSMPVGEFIGSEVRFAALARAHPDHAKELADLLQKDVDERWHYYQQLAGVQRTVVHEGPPGGGEAGTNGKGSDGEVPSEKES
ncbi:MAG TPA: pyruvate:ferredoxin (flavodoxin) oxidoreductase [Acidimicrobiales bacterium]|nr:pyruvate:ferredoxin (flavodoxin) oxidoreductase [Acidimicrobiales bacterium]